MRDAKARTDEVARNGALSRINFGQRFFLGAPCISEWRYSVGTTFSKTGRSPSPMIYELRPSPL